MRRTDLRRERLDKGHAGSTLEARRLDRLGEAASTVTVVDVQADGRAAEARLGGILVPPLDPIECAACAVLIDHELAREVRVVGLRGLLFFALLHHLLVVVLRLLCGAFGNDRLHRWRGATTNKKKLV